MINGLSYQEDLSILNVYKPNSKLQKKIFFQENFDKTKEESKEINNHTWILTPLCQKLTIRPTHTHTHTPQKPGYEEF